MSQIKDIFFIKTILDRATAGSHNGETGYYSVSDNMFSEGHSCYCDNGNDYYSDLKGIFDCDSTLPSFDSYHQTMFDAGQLSMTIVKMAANNYLSILVGGQNVSLNYDGNYYYTQNYYSSYGGTWWRWDYINGELTNYTMYSGGSYATIDENVETTLYSSMPIKMYYSGADRDINYARIAGDQGIGSGGWQVPNPNPTYKIMINGSEPDDIKLNGVTPDKIMLNGVCYFEKLIPEPTYLYKWDFTKSLTDEVQGQVATLSNATFEEGIGVSGAADAYIKLFGSINLIGNTMEIDYKSLTKTASSGLVRVLGRNSNNFFGYDIENSNYKCKKNNSTQQYTKTSSNSSFTNVTFKLIFTDIYNLTVQVNNEDLYVGGTFHANNSLAFYIGNAESTGSAGGFGNFTVTGVRIYANEE